PVRKFLDSITLANGLVQAVSFDNIATSDLPGGTTVLAPQGRLTLTTGKPVMPADATAQATIYYTPFQGNLVPIYDGSALGLQTFAEITLALDTSNHLATNLYDVFVWNNASTIQL